MKATAKFAKTLIAATAASAVILGGCKNFMSDSSDFKAAIQSAVDVANAEQLSVNIAPSDTAKGSTTPYPSSTVKVGVAFSIAATASSKYGFIRWAAYIGASSEDETSGVVTFASATSAITTAVVNVARSDIYIRPVFAARPLVKKHLPKEDSGYYNAAIQYTFSKAINPASFTFDDGSTKSSAGLFKNITIKTADTDVSLEKNYFGSPSLSDDGLVLTIPLKDATTGLSAYKDWDITVVVSRTITDTVGLTMAEDDEYTFTVGGLADTHAPLLQKIDASWGMDDSIVEYSDSDSGDSESVVKLRRFGAVTDDVPFTLYLTGSDSGSGVFAATITESLSYLADGTSASSSGTYTRTLSGSSPYSVWFYSSSNTMATTSDGYVSFKIKLRDNAGNIGDATEKTYPLIRDTTPPPVDSTQLARISLSAAGTETAGYYNGTASLSFTLTNVQDYGVDPYRSESVSYRFGFKSDLSDASSWTAVANAATATANATLAVSSYTGSDSASVPVYFQLKDDLGNTSDITKIQTVTIDKTAPTGTITATSVTAINSKNMIGSTSVPVTVVGSDAMSGIKSYYVAGGDGTTQPTAPTDSSDWLDYSTTATNSATATVGSSDGSKHVWVWFKDKAGNVSSAISDSQSLTLDNTDPVVTKFFVNKSTAFASATDPSAPAKQYTNSQTVYFAIKATEATGIGSFAYSADGGTTWSNYFSATTTATQTDADHAGYGVSLCNSAELSSGYWLVTGKLTVPATDGDKALQVKVRDLVRTTSDVTSYSSASAGMTVTPLMYDDTAPTISGAAISSTSTYAGTTYTYVGDTAVTLAYTAADATSGLLTRSLSGDLASSVADLTLGSAAEGTKTSTKSEALTLSSGDGAKTVLLTVSDWAANSYYKTFQAYLDKTAPTFTAILNQTSSSATTYSNATTGSVVLAGPAQSSKAWSSFYTYMTSHGETGSGMLGGLTQPFTFYRVTPAQVSAAVSAGTLSATATGYSGTAVGGTALAGYTMTDNGETIDTTGGATAGNVLVSYNYGKNVTLPTDTVTADSVPLSGYYVVGYKAKDNVGNPSDEKKIGYFYDQTKPIITGFKVFDTSGNEVTIYKSGSYAYVAAPSSNLAEVRLYATDRPTSDPAGAGIYLFNPSIFQSSLGTSVTSSQNITESSETTPTDRYFVINSSTGSTWNLDTNQYLRFNGTVYDQSSNYQTTYTALGSSYYYLAMDNQAPSFTLSFPTTYSGAVSGVSYIKTTTGATFTPSDPTSPHLGSGVASWALDSSSSTDPSSSYSSGSVPAASALSTLLGSASSPVYLHLKDNVGNVSHNLLGTYCLDTTDPVVTGSPVIFTDSALANAVFTTDSTNWYTNATKVYIGVKANDRATDTDGSGIKTISTYCSAAGEYRNYTIASPAQTETADTWYMMKNTDSSTDGYWDGYAGMSSAWTFVANIYDAVGNSTTTSTCFLYYDGASPSVGDTITKNNTSTVDSTEYCGSATTLQFSATDAATFAGGASGIAAWGIKTSDSSPTASDAAVAGSWTGWQAVASPTTGDSSVSITTAAGVVSSLVSGSTTLYIYVKDNAGNVSAKKEAGTFNIDTTAPTVSTVTPVSGHLGGASSKYYVNDAETLTFTAADNDGGSGMSRYYLSSSKTETNAVVTSGTGGSGSGGEYTGDPVPLKNSLSTSEAKLLYLYVADKVGNVTIYGGSANPTAVTSNALILDSTVPAFSGNLIIDPTKPSSTSSTNGAASVNSPTGHKVKFYVTNAESSGSGVKTITLSGNVTSDQASNWVVSYANGSSLTTLAGSGSGLTYTLTNAYTGTNPLVISNVTLSSAATIAVSATMTDAAENSSASATSQGVTYDQVSPTATASLADSISVMSGYCDDVNPVLTLTCTESLSGISTIQFTGGASGISSVTIKKYDVAGTTSTTISDLKFGDTETTDDDSSATLITLPVPLTLSSQKLEISGFSLSSTVDGEKTVTVNVADAAGNSTTVTTEVITLDTAAPTVTVAPAITATNGLVYAPGDTAYIRAGTLAFTLTDATGGSYLVNSTDGVLINWAGSSTFTSGSTVSIAASTILSSTASEWYLHYKDGLGNQASTQIKHTPTATKWALDTTAPTITALTGSSGTTGTYYASGTSAATFWYRTSGTSSTVTFTEPTLTETTAFYGLKAATTDPGYASTDLPPSGALTVTLVNTTANNIYVFDAVGNWTKVTVSYSNDATAPTVTTAPAITATNGLVYAPSDTAYIRAGTLEFKLTEALGGSYLLNSTGGDLSDWTDSSTFTSGSTISLAASTILSTSASALYLHYKDLLGNQGTAQIKYSDTITKWALDTTAPTITALTGSSGTTGTYYASGTSAATFWYKTSGTSSTVTFTEPTLTETTAFYRLKAATTDPGYASTDLPPSGALTVTLVDTTPNNIYVFDAVGNWTKVTVTYSNDADAPTITVPESPTISGLTVSGLSTSDASGSGIVSYSCMSAETSGSSVGSFDGSSVTINSGAISTTNGSVTSIYLFAYDRVGRYRECILKFTGNGTSFAYTSTDTTKSGSRWGAVPTVTGNIGRQYAAVIDNPVKTALTSNGVVDWGIMPVPRTTKMSGTSSTQTVFATSNKISSVVPGSNASASSLSIQSLHGLAVSRATRTQTAMSETAQATSSATVGDASGSKKGSTVSAREAQLALIRSAFAPLVGKYLAAAPLGKEQQQLFTNLDNVQFDQSLTGYERAVIESNLSQGVLYEKKRPQMTKKEKSDE